MAGTKAGAEKRRQTMINERFGGDEAAYIAWQRQNGAKGGSNPNPDNPANFKNNKKLARKAGKKSGRVRRDKATVYGTEPDNLQRIGTEPGGTNATE